MAHADLRSLEQVSGGLDTLTPLSAVCRRFTGREGLHCAHIQHSTLYYLPRANRDNLDYTRANNAGDGL